jgi:hypothetical protein
MAKLGADLRFGRLRGRRFPAIYALRRRFYTLPLLAIHLAVIIGCRVV